MRSLVRGTFPRISWRTECVGYMDPNERNGARRSSPRGAHHPWWAHESLLVGQRRSRSSSHFLHSFPPKPKPQRSTAGIVSMSVLKRSPGTPPIPNAPPGPLSEKGITTDLEPRRVFRGKGHVYLTFVLNRISVLVVLFRLLPVLFQFGYDLVIRRHRRPMADG